MVQLLEPLQVATQNSDGLLTTATQERRTRHVIFVVLGVMFASMVLIWPGTHAALAGATRVAGKSLRTAASKDPTVQFQAGLPLPLISKPSGASSSRSRASLPNQPVTPSHPVVRRFPQMTAATAIAQQETSLAPSGAELVTKVCLNVKLCVKPEMREAFLECIRANQAGTLSTEPLALEYVWGEDRTTPNTFHFYEMYLGMEGFEAHKASAHFAAWEVFASQEPSPFTEPPRVEFYEEQAPLVRHTVGASANDMAEFSANPLRIGATIPNFNIKTTKGDFKFHDWLKNEEKPWTIFFSHPKDYTPVCTTELGACHTLNEKFEKMGAKLIGLSCDPLEEHNGWSADVLHREGKHVEGGLAFPLIADADRKIATELGMLDPETAGADALPLPARALVILYDTTVKLTILYPASTGRNFDEVFRVLTSLQLTAGQGLATPANWKYGDRVIVGPSVKTEDAKAKFNGFEQEEMLSGKPYLRSVDCPDCGKTPP